MSGFTGEWLALREPADHAARSSEIAAFVCDALAGSPGSPHVEIVDLGSGTGSNVRYLSPRMSARQQWTLIGDDAALLASAQGSTPERRAAIRVVHADLADVERILPERCDLVTASALLDLVSDGWLQKLVDACRRRRAAVLAALDYDGRIACEPAVPDDERVRELVNRHQRTDKGLGPALGPDASRRAEVLLRDAGYDVRHATSDWVLGDAHAPLQRQLIHGWAMAAGEIDPAEAPRIGAWTQERLALIDAGRSRIRVGHVDVGARLSR